MNRRPIFCASSAQAAPRVRIASAVIPLLAALAAVPAPCAAATTGDMPTIDRVEYVMDCMHHNGSNQTMLYKCSCAIDVIAKEYSYDDYVEASTIVHGQGTVGEVAGVFREGERNREIAGHFRKVQADANRQCGVPK